MKLFEKCRSCDSRYVGCHANCHTYIRDRKRLDKVRAKRLSEYDYIEYVIDNMKRKRG